MSTPGQVDTEIETTAAPGERLRLAREALNLSQQDVAERIRIGVDKVAALEIDEVARVGAPVFAAGYIRAYARIVGLPADELIPRFDGLEHLAARPATLASAAVDGNLERLSAGLPAALSRGNGRRRGATLRLIGAGLLILALVGALLWVMDNGSLSLPAAPVASTPAKPLPQNALPASAVERPGDPLPEPPRVESDSHGPQTLAIPAQVEAEPASEPVGREEDLALAPNARAAASGDEPADAGEALAAEVMNELDLYFQEDSWVEVRDARGERLMHRLARAGQSQSLRGVAPFAVVLGYVPGVTILLDGEALDLSRYQGRRLARFSVGAETANEN